MSTGISWLEYQKYMNRVGELVTDGYLVFRDQDRKTVDVTTKGLAVLMASADRPIVSPKRLTRPKRVISHARQKPRDNSDEGDHEHA